MQYERERKRETIIHYLVGGEGRRDALFAHIPQKGLKVPHGKLVFALGLKLATAESKELAPSVPHNTSTIVKREKGALWQRKRPG